MDKDYRPEDNGAGSSWLLLERYIGLNIGRYEIRKKVKDILEKAIIEIENLK